jgi:hypothetical protein
VLDELLLIKESDINLSKLGEYLADLTLLSMEIRSQFDLADIALACRIIARVAIGCSTESTISMLK